MGIGPNGTFNFTIEPADLSRGLRPSRYSPRNQKFLTVASRAIGLDGVLKVLSDISDDLIDTSVITDSYPFPQLFVFNELVIVCGETKIYELVSGVLTLKLTVTAGLTWHAVDFFDYVYMSNSKVAVVRKSEDMTWELSDLPVATGICNYNGQVLIGAPGVELT